MHSSNIPGGASIFALSLALMAGSAIAPASAAAQAAQPDTLIDDIVVTAQKRGVAEAAQDIPVAITALNERQIEESHVTTIESLTLIAPNVALESNGTTRGVANFTIRGLAVNSSITSIEPTVGTFVDGVYMGTNIGVVTDVFDLESVEVLRGPQGTLFGRNVTGGAVLLRTARPTDRLQAKMQASVETGPEYRVAASVGGPIAGDTVLAKIMASYNHDDGWFHNRFTDAKHGENETFLVRPTLVFNISPDIETTLIYEHGETDGDGTAFKNLPDNFRYKDINTNFTGFYRLNWDSLTSETNIRVGFGDGTITNVFGWRTVKQDGGNDVDGTPFQMFHLLGYVDQEQYSNELRYAGTFGMWKPTIGVFYFTQDFISIDQRDVGPPVAGGLASVSGGGTQDQEGWAIFTQNDFDLSEQLTLTLGARYSHETKEAQIARIGAGHCDLQARTCDFTTPGALIDKESWSSFSPKLGLQWKPNNDVLFYGSFSRATRSGGYNFRRNNPLDTGKFDQETMTAFEIGGKTDLFDRKVRANFALFYNIVEDTQRDIIIPGTALGGSGTVQVITNAADTDIYGGELEIQYSPNRHWLFNLNAGYTENQYKNVVFDLNNDGVVNSIDTGLALPRLAPWSVGAALTFNHDIGDGNVRANVSFAYRDKAALNEANSLFLPTHEKLDFDLSYTFKGEMVTVSLYGKNMLNHFTGGTGAPLVAPGVSPLAPDGVLFIAPDEGRVVGAQVRVKL